MLVYLRKDETFSDLGAGFAVSTSTAWRYVEETVMLLAARAPKLAQALRNAKRDELLYLVLDGTHEAREGRGAELQLATGLNLGGKNIAGLTPTTRQTLTLPYRSWFWNVMDAFRTHGERSL